jgi:ABC-type transporter Mla subunit MlaD
MGWLLPVLGALAIIGLGWHFLSGPSRQETATAPAPVTGHEITTGALPDPLAPGSQILETLRGVKAGDVDIGQQTADALSKLRASLQTITDEPSAQNAMAPLKASADEFNRLSGMLSQLSPENRALFAKAVATMKPTLDQLCDKALQIPAVSALIKPTVDSIRSEINTLATA